MSGLFGRKQTTLSQQSQQISGVRVQTSLYGVVIPLVYGWNRISANLIWYGDFNKQKAPTPSSSGKGGLTSGGKGSNTQYNYFASLQLALCEGPILGIGRIWDSQGDLALNQAIEPFVIEPGVLTYQVAHFQNFLSDNGTTREDSFSTTVTDPGAPGPITLGGVQLTPMVLVPSAPAAGQYTLNTGTGTYGFSSADVGKTILITYTYSVPSTDSSGVPVQQFNYTVFLGTRPQTPWGYLTTNHPTFALGYTGIAYLAQANAPLGSAGMLPNQSFEIYGFLQFGGGIVDVNPRDFVIDFCTNPLYGAGLSASDIGDLTIFSNYCIANGLFFSPLIDQQRAASDWLNDILAAANSEAFWSAGQLKIVPYGDQTAVGNGVTFTPNTQPIYDLTDDDFISDGNKDPIQITRPTVQDAYNSVQIEFSNRSNSYNAEIVEARDQNAVETYTLRQEGPQSWHFITQQVVAAAAAQTRLSRSCFIRRIFDFTVTNRYILLEPMDVVTLTDVFLGLSKTPVRIKSIDEQTNGNLKMTAEEIPFGVSTPTLYPKQPVTTSGPQSQAQPGPINPPIIFEALSRLNQQIGYEVVFALSGASPNWGGCDIAVSTDGSTYKNVGRFQNKSRMGVATNALPASIDPDTADTLSVNLAESNGTLLSGTQADCDSLKTLCYLGGELISYQNAILTSPNNYNLTTRLRRGVFGSSISSHPAGTPFVRLDDNTFTWDFDATLIGTTVFFKFTSFNNYQLQEEPLSTVAVYSLALVGDALGLLTPGHVTYRPLSNPLTAHDSGLVVGDSFNRQSLVQALGSAVNLVPDSNGTQLTWVSDAQIAFSNTGGAIAGGKWTYTGTGAASSIRLAASQVFAVRPGVQYTLSGYIDATHVTAGTPIVAIFNAASVGAAMAFASQTAGVNGRISVTFTVPAGAPLVLVAFDTNNCTVANTQPLVFSDSQLEAAASASAYSPASANWGQIFPLPPFGTFTGADQLNLASWLPALWSQPDIVPAAVSAANNPMLWLQNNPFPADQSVSLVITALDAGNNDSVGVMARCSTTSGGNGYLANVGRNTNVLSLYKLVAGTFTLLVSTPVTFHIGDVVQLQAVGTTIQCLVNGIGLIQVTDSSVASGQPGIDTFQASAGPVSLTRATAWQALDATQSTISVAAFTMRIPGLPDVALNAGSIPGLAPDTIYFVFYDDPGFVGDTNGPVTYQATTLKEAALNSAGRFYVGSIRTPKAGAPDTIGAGDGGTGAQSGMLNVLSFSTNNILAGAGLVTNLPNFNDGDPTTFAVISFVGTSTQCNIQCVNVPKQTRRFSSYTLKVLFSVPVNTFVTDPHDPANPVLIFAVFVNNVFTRFATVQSAAGPQGLTTAIFALPTNLNFGNVANFYLQVLTNPPLGATGGEAMTVNLYEAWIEAVE